MPQQPSLHHPDDDTIVASLDDVMNPDVKLGVAYWRSLCGGRRYPAHKDLSLRGMAAILPYAVIVKVIDGGADYEYRYVGDVQRQAFGTHFKGLRVSRIESELPRLGALIRSAYEQVRSSGIPFVTRGRVAAAGTPQAKPLFHETAFLPLGAGDAAVDHLLMVGVHVPTPFWSIPADKLASLSGQLHASAAAS